METFENIKNSLFNSVGIKLALIAFLSVVLLIPSAMIMGLIREREQRRDETIREVTAIWANAQTITGPVLTLSYRNPGESRSDEISGPVHYAHFLPENLKVSGTIEPQIRYRGIYHVVTYRAIMHFSGDFLPPDLSALQIKSATDRTYRVEIGIPDMRGINQNIQLKWNDSVLNIIPGMPDHDISPSGVHAILPAGLAAPVKFNFDIDLNGSSGLNFIPLGKQTTVNLTSAWSNPSFIGAFLPDNRNVTRNGFTATWQILQLNRNYPQQWIDEQYNVSDSSFGVSLMNPLDNYQKSMRSVKYAILFIGLTFLIFFFSEVMTGIRIHPVNYLLVGVALLIFYSLLTALSEYLPFAIGYLISGTIIIAMIAAFTRSLYRKMQVTFTVSLVLATLYLFLFVILQLTDYSLLFGNIGLVIILGFVMYFSRKIDWYAPVRSIK